jgi:hypothetical protein
LIHESLSDIKKALRQLEHNSVSLSPSTVAESESASASPYVPVKVFEGDLSFNKHSEHATLSAEISAAAPESIQTAEVVSSLSSLKSLLDGQNLPSRINELRFPNASPHVSGAKVELPPVSLVIAVLKRANSKDTFRICITPLSNRLSRRANPSNLPTAVIYRLLTSRELVQRYILPHQACSS